MGTTTITTAAQSPERSVREFARVRGGVQGVGFRPFVHALASRLGLSGHVGNDSDGVFIEVEGRASQLDAFFVGLEAYAPPLARIEMVQRSPRPLAHGEHFTIVTSVPADTHRAVPGHALVAPDVCVCEDCLHEMREPGNRRFGYPFMNCTNCGPRYTIIRALPYDRAQTTMSGFAMCPDCQTEYDTPTDRRFHAQPNACPTCGPQLWWEECATTASETSSPRNHVGAALDRAFDCLKRGGTVAVKGIGGFHLACDATSVTAVERLRARKHRPHKPLAVMVASLDVARRCATISRREAELLESRERPIVLVQRRADSPLANNIAPRHDAIGLLLPYSPLHHLLLAHGPLVMTSGNISDEPIAHTNDEARARLAPLCDGLLLHNRDIHVPCDDSVLRIHDDAPLPMRRSRGYAPYPVALPIELSPQVLAMGGEIKSTICLARERHAFLSAHIGDVEGMETRTLLSRTIAHVSSLLDVTPTLVACDAHPGYASTAIGRAWAEAHGVPVTLVQHHHAHVASLMAEHGIADGPIIGVAFDGTGYGSDGTIWGGEVLLATYSGFERAAHLGVTMLPGGDAAVRHPGRVALAQLYSAGVAWDAALKPVADTTDEERRVLRQQLVRSVGCVPSSSMGRFFDAAAALAGGAQRVTYEGQAAIEFETLARRAAGDDTMHDDAGAYRFALAPSAKGALVFDGAPVLAALASDMLRGARAERSAWHVHNAVADVVVRVAERVRAERGRSEGSLDTVGLTGGVFQNTLLLSMCERGLRDAGFRVLTHRKVPPNDGGLALGQAMIAAAQWGRA